MNEIKIYLKPSGSMAELYKDFNLYQGSYRNVQISIYVPTSILYKNADNTFYSTVQTGAIITAPNGAKVTTLSNSADYVKTEVVNNVEYAVYTQIMPKEYAMYAGTQIIVCNVVNVDNTDETKPKIISVITTQRAPLVVLESAYLSKDEPLDPSESEVIEGLINNLKELLLKGYYSARAIYAWNPEYTYGANEIVFYPNIGELGAFVKSKAADNTSVPYSDGQITENWEEVVNFNEVQDALNEAVEQGQNAATSAEAARVSAENATAQATAAEQSAKQTESLLSQSEAQAESLLSQSEAQAESLLSQSETQAKELVSQASAQANAAANSAASAKTQAELAAQLLDQFATYGVKINTEYSSYEELPVPGNSNNIYFVPNGGSGDNGYDEWVWVEDKNSYEKIGTTDIDLSGYVPVTRTINGKPLDADIEITAEDIPDLPSGGSEIYEHNIKFISTGFSVTMQNNVNFSLTIYTKDPEPYIDNDEKFINYCTAHMGETFSVMRFNSPTDIIASGYFDVTPTIRGINLNSLHFATNVPSGSSGRAKIVSDNVIKL